MAWCCLHQSDHNSSSVHELYNAVAVSFEDSSAFEVLSSGEPVVAPSVPGRVLHTHFHGVVFQGFKLSSQPVSNLKEW